MIDNQEKEKNLLIFINEKTLRIEYIDDFIHSEIVNKEKEFKM